MRYAVLGAQGQLGRDLCPLLKGEVIQLTRAEIDLSQPETIKPALEALQPTHFLNCAAYNFVDKAETDPTPAFGTNAWAMRELARACQAVNCQLIHFSSDYVFGLDTNRTTPYEIDETPGPLSQYGVSKLAGEYLVRASTDNHLIVRTCGLYGVWGSGGKGGNFVETMLRVAGQGKPLRVVNDQHCTPSYTVDVAAAVVQLIEAQARGVFHVTNSGSCTWYEFAGEIFRQMGISADLKPITSAEFNAPAPRPAYSVLSTGKLTQMGLSAMRLWREALAAYLVERSAKVLSK